jgi:DNA (cytosine-5)-methyltransferase 1
MKKWAYYNEYDKNAAAWLRELISLGLIMDGEVDERSIIDVKPEDLRGYVRVGFFAGIGGWDRALQLAGWPEDRPIWHGSCPCQPFSCAGAGKGTNDHRHLWPVFFNLIRECRPGIVIGEQVASKAALAWFDGVCSDLEGADYASGAVDLCAAGVNSPNIRQRLYWMAYSQSVDRRCELKEIRTRGGRSRPSGSGGMGDTAGDGSASWISGQEQRQEGESGELDDASNKHGSELGVGLADTQLSGPQGGLRRREDQEREDQHGYSGRRGPIDFWAQYELIPCRDGKFRRIEPGVPPLIRKFESRPSAVADGVLGGMVRGGDIGISEDKGDAQKISGWRTPTSSDARRGFENNPKSRNSKAGTGSLNNEAALAGWGTPRVTNNSGIPCPEHTGNGSRIEDQVALAGWPTPQVCTGPNNGKNRGKAHGGARPRNTPQNVVDLVTGWPTPNTMDHIERDGLRPSRIKTGRTGGYITEVAGWPTPMAGTDGAGNNDGRRKMVELSGWPTPSSEGSAGEVSDDLERRGGKFVNTKTGRVLQTNLATDVKMLTGWPTPRAEDSESTGAHRGAPDTMTSAARLAPSEIEPIHWANATGEGRVMRLKGYGNSICIPIAAEFISAVMEILPPQSPAQPPDRPV